MSLCVASAGSVLTLLAGSFSLSWTHSVEKTTWIEHWQIAGDKLVLTRASVQGSGAGVALPPDAIWQGDHWTFDPHLPPLLGLNLASSGATVGGWQLCADGACHQLGAAPGDDVSVWATQSTCEVPFQVW